MLLSKPVKAKEICLSLAEKIKKQFNKIDIILAPAMGGIVIGYEIGRVLNVETIFAERVDGKFHLRRGFEIKKNQRVLLLEDVITTGKSIKECARLAQDFEANILGFACLIDRSDKKIDIKKQIVSQVEIDIPTYDEKNLPSHLSKIKPTKPGSRNL